MAETRPNQQATDKPVTAAETPATSDKSASQRKSLSKRLKAFFFGQERTAFIVDITKLNKITDLEEAKMYLEIAETQLQDSVETGQIITERATNMLNLTSGLLIALVAYCIDKWETNYHQVTPLLKMAFWGCGALVLMSGLLVAAILPKDYCIPGWQPKHIFNSRAFNDNADSNIRQMHLCFNLLTSYQNNIEENISLNKKRWALFNWAMFLILITPLCFAAYYLFFR